MDNADATERSADAATSTYSVSALDLVFKNRYRAEQLLKPELQKGNLTLHDYNLSTRFFGGWSKYAPTAFGLVGAVIPYLIKPAGLPLPSRLKTAAEKYTGILAFVTGSIGVVAGQGYHFRSHFEFLKQLENPKGFERAMDNVYHGINPRSPVHFRLPSIAFKGKALDGVEAGKEADPAGLGMAPGKEVEEGMMVDRMEDTGSPPPYAPRSIAPPSTTGPPESQSPSRSKSTWDEIRAANASQGPQSSWDALRRRSSGPSSPVSGSQGKPQAALSTGENVQVLVIDENEDPERAVDQKRFDDMLEEERRKAAGADGPKKGGVDKWL
ncbi:hypothetical protein OE88DRAFT_1730583 [Heliocybe sulcata]|uniref:Uncharacterized protein n=1 Tax=Heliocybe sulcata TaxID=5364 RepID=A0A5C3NJV1_9AGAM|nr:hypothetical protein OE88DRAFT_1730583 [Heliocybe sulcata]